MAAHLVEIEGLTQRYPSVVRPVLEAVNLTIDAGERVAIVGPSGSGKSTLLHVMGGLLPPTEGSVRLDGASFDGKTADELAAVRNLQIGFVFQAHHLLPQCSALENVLVPTLAGARSDRGDALERGRRLLDDVGLGHRLDHRPAAMSGGECQRVAVVRALINGPRLLLADEPTGSLDSVASEHLAELFNKVSKEEGVAVVTVTHSSELAARMDRVLGLLDGRLTEREPTP